MQHINRFFEALARQTIKTPWPFLLLSLVVSALLILQLPKLKIDTSPYAFFEPDEPVIVKYDQFLDEFDRDEVAVVTIKADDILAPEFLRLLEDFHHALASDVPHVDEVISLVNASSIKGIGDELVVKDLLEAFPISEKMDSDFRREVLSHPLYPRLLVSEDARYTSVIIRPRAFHVSEAGLDDLLEGFDTTDELIRDSESSSTRLTPEQNGEFSKGVYDVVERFQGPDVQFLVAGLAIINHELLLKLNREVPKFTIVAICFISVLLFLLFRRISGILLPLFVVLIALASTLGLMAISGKPFNVFTQVLPSFLLAVGIGDAVHLLTIFYREFDKSQDKHAALVYAMSHTGLAMLMTSLTTAAGLLSFAVSEIAAIGYLGIFAATGAMVAFVLSMLLLPTLIVILPLKPMSHVRHGRVQRWLEDTLSRLSVMSTRHPGKIILVSAIIAGVALYGAFQLRFHYDAVEWFPEDEPLRIASRISNVVMNGNMFVEIVLDTGESNGVKKADFLLRLDTLQQELLHLRGEEGMNVAKAVSIVDTVKLINQALHENNPDYYRIPETDEMVAQEILLFENSGADDLEALVSADFSSARMTLKLPWTSAGAYESFLALIRNHVDSVFEQKQEFTLTGMISLLTETSSQAIKSMTESYILAAATIAIMMMLLLRSVRIGLIAMIPNLFPILVALGLMGLLGFPLDLSSILVGSIAIGLSVDDTIYFMHHFRRYLSQTGNVVEAVDHTLHSAGRAMLVTTIVLSIGFFVFGLSEMTNLVSFGLVTGFAIIMALVSDLILAPALMAIAVRNPQLCRCLMR